MKNLSRFIEVVERHFGFLIDQYEFEIRRTVLNLDNAEVLLESNEVYVDVRFGPPDYFVQLRFGLKNPSEGVLSTPLEQGDLTMLECCSSWVWRKDHEDPLENSVAELSRLLKTCGEKFVKGDKDFYQAASLNRSDMVQHWIKNQNADKVRKRADSAWEMGRHAEVIDLYESIKNELTKVELKKLDISKKRLGETK